ncbi:MAG TPA: hypothetical protein VMH04_01260 [Candidatus Solibacter sp.]|nr:hypothetical protein [Candidatus Solibacter sp.]
MSPRSFFVAETLPISYLAQFGAIGRVFEFRLSVGCPSGYFVKAVRSHVGFKNPEDRCRVRDSKAIFSLSHERAAKALIPAFGSDVDRIDFAVIRQGLPCRA